MSGDWPAALECGSAGRAIEAAGRSGDLAVFAPSSRGGLVVVIDGLGHGGPAADASEAAAAILRAHVDEPAQALLERCHAALRKTRGAVMTLAWFDVEAATLAWTGVGNVEARLVRGPGGANARYDSPVVLGGVVGFNLPQVRVGVLDLQPGDALAMATDGVAADFSTSLEPGVGAQTLADRMLERHAKGTDDALAVVVRYLG